MDNSKKAKQSRQKKDDVFDINPYQCGYCNKIFKKEKAFLVHMCTKKERYLLKDERYVRMAFLAYNRFYEKSVRGKKKNYDDFVNSTLYNDFINFGRYMCNINVVNPLQFVDFLIESCAKMVQWTNPVVYDLYIREMSKTETVDAAAERNILLMQQWALDTGKHWTDFFRLVNPVLATNWIKSGRISPWILFVSKSAEELFARLSDEQLLFVQETLDTGYWEKKLLHNQHEVKQLQHILEGAGL